MVFNETIVLCWDLITIIQTLATVISLKQRVLEKNPKIKISGYPRHVLHNTAMKASTAFAKITKFDIEDHCADLHYWFEKSSKQKSALEDY